MIFNKSNNVMQNASDGPSADILFITKAKFPNDNAFAIYISSIASIYSKCNFNVLCVGNGNSECSKTYESYFGKYVSLRNNKCSTIIQKIKNQLTLERRIFEFIKENVKNPKHVFFSCEFSLAFYKKVKEHYSDLNVKYTFIVTEEYTQDEFEKYSLLNKKSLNVNHYFVNEYTNKNDSFIVISRFLHNKVSVRGNNAVYIPFSFSEDYIKSVYKPPKSHELINYIYCGNPENKDMLSTVIKAFLSLNDADKKKVLFNIIGVDEKWAIKHGINNFDRNFIHFFGRKKIDFISEMYSVSDYSLLLRDESKTFAKAGFPTKISESMTFGVTPITNMSSNLDEYLDKSNSIIIEGHQINDVVKAIEFSINDIKNNEKRRINALKTANKYFDIERYKMDLIFLINK